MRGSCIQEWFRLHGDGRKEKLTADGQFIVLLGHAITQDSNIFCPFLFAELTVNCFLKIEYLDLDLADVDCRIELVYTPIREDGLQGSPRSVISDTILPGSCFFTNCLIVVVKHGF